MAISAKGVEGVGRTFRVDATVSTDDGALLAKSGKVGEGAHREEMRYPMLSHNNLISILPCVDCCIMNEHGVEVEMSEIVPACGDCWRGSHFSCVYRALIVMIIIQIQRAGGRCGTICTASAPLTNVDAVLFIHSTCERSSSRLRREQEV